MIRSTLQSIMLAVAFLGPLSGCGDLPPVVPLSGCVDGYRRCVAEGVETCVGGAWQQAVPCGVDQECRDGECVLKEPLVITECGNGTLEAGESCDGPNLGLGTCEGLGYPGGVLSCNDDCSYDSADCDPHSEPPSCNDGVRDEVEECDGSDLGGEDCGSLGFSGGTLACAEDCSFDLRACEHVAPATCGDGMRNGSEVCEDTDLGGADCAALGYVGGTLSCTGGCSFDESQCVSGPPESWLLTRIDNSDVHVAASATTPQGITFIVGTYDTPSVTLGGITLVGDPAELQQGFLAKSDSTGAVVWAENIPGDPVDVIQRPPNGVYVLTGLGTVAKILKVSPAGQIAPAKGVITGTLSIAPGRLAVDATHVYVAGTISSGTLTINAMSKTATVQEEIFVAALDHGLQTTYWLSLTGAKGGGVRGLALEGQTSGLYLLANFEGDWITGASVAGCTSAGGQDVLLAGFEAGAGQALTEGTLKSAHCLGSVGDDLARHLAVSANGQVYASGYLAAQPAAMPGLSVITGSRDFISRYDTTIDKFVWVKEVNMFADRLAVGASGTIYAAGQSYAKTVLAVREFSEANATHISGRSISLAGPNQHARVVALTCSATGETVTVGNFTGTLSGYSTSVQSTSNVGFFWRQ